MRTLISGVCLTMFAAALWAQSPKGLEIYYIDTEGGQSTLFVGPTGESLLVDAGNAGDRDLGRIVETLKSAGVRQIDHMWITHYHSDHVGAVVALAEQFPVKQFLDHGKPDPADRIVSAAFYAAYEKLAEGRRTSVKPGDKIQMAGLDITTVASAGQVLRSSLKGGGQPNAACADLKPRDESAYFDPDNGYSAGFVMQYGRFRTVDLGDLTWNAELELMCPANRIGPVDLYLTSHHGLAQSGSPALVHGLQPRVAVMNNGTRKGGELAAFKVLFDSPGLENLWQLHWAYGVGLENAPATFIANIDDGATIAGVLNAPQAAAGPGPGPGAGPGPGRGGVGGGGAASHSPAYLIKVSAQSDGTFTVTNTRNGFSKTYKGK